MSTQRTYPVERLAVLYPLNLDTISTIVLLQEMEAGRQTFPDIEGAAIELWDTGEGPYGIPADQLLQEQRILAVNCGGGMLDHHPHGAFEGECTFSMALELIGLDRDPRLEELRKYVIWDDIRLDPTKEARPPKEAGRFTWGRLVKDIQDDTDQGLTPEEQWDQAVERVYDAIDVLRKSFLAYMGRQTRFFGDAATAFAAARREDFVLARSDRREETFTYRVAMGNCECDEFGVFARSKHGCGAHIVIHHRPKSGHVQITTSEWPLFELQGLVQRLREEEIRRKNPDGRLWLRDAGGREFVPDTASLRCEGTMAGVPEWYFIRRRPGNRGTSLVVNGTRRHHRTPRTAIPLAGQDVGNTIWGIVVSWLLNPASRPEPREPRPRRGGPTAPAPTATTPEADDDAAVEPATPNAEEA